MEIRFAEMKPEQAAKICSWRYEPPYDIYNTPARSSTEVISELTDPVNGVFAATVNEELIGFRSFGPDGRVPGGNYDDLYLDTGGGLRPDLTGRGLGENWLRRGIEFGSERFNTRQFCVSVAHFNERAVKVCKRVGFTESQKFLRLQDDEPFVMLSLEVDDMIGGPAMGRPSV